MRNLTRPKRITVFCGAACPTESTHLQAAAATGRLLAEQGIHLVYGGGRLGLMGALADGALAAGGTVTGIIPRALHRPGIVHPALSVLQIVPDLATRKTRLLELADAVIALPGGFGTLDELAYAWASDVPSTGPRPVGLLNTGGYYEPLMDFVRSAAAAGFLAHHPSPLDEVVVADGDPARLLQTLTARTLAPSVSELTATAAREGAT